MAWADDTVAPEQPSVAPDKYKVELIVFEHLTPNSINSENWPSYPSLPDLKNSIELMAPLPTTDSDELTEIVIQPQDFQLLSTADFQMNPFEDKLKSQRYKILVHSAWIQSFDSPKQAKPIHIYGGENNTRPLQTSDYDDDQADFIPYIHGDNYELDGTIELSLQKYINLHLNLSLNLPTSSLAHMVDLSSFDPQLARRDVVSFRLIQSRRMRSDELHYIDHPLFGVLVKITPITKNGEFVIKSEPGA